MRETIKQIEERRAEKVKKNISYKFLNWKLFNFNILHNITATKRTGQGKNRSYPNCFIMADTETSKDPKRIKGGINHVVIWTISLRSMGFNWVTLWGNKPSELTRTIELMKYHIRSDDLIIYWHNMGYDWIFIRKFMFNRFGYPKEQLSTKPHFPILFRWENGLTFKDSYILAGRSLERWAKDMNVEHQKACGKWDYDRIRNQDFTPDPDEAEYIEHDTLAGVECLDALRIQLNKKYGTMPFTATGIPREELRNISRKNRGRRIFNHMVPSYETYIKLERSFHGGYTHNNRYLSSLYNEDLLKNVVCYDLTSSYPFALCSGLYPMERFTALDEDLSPEDILNDRNYGYIMKLIMIAPKLKDPFEVMPVLQYSKCSNCCINPVIDNGRILEADYLEIYINSVDLELIYKQYDAKEWICTECECAELDYLPRWMTDYVFKCFSDKQLLKGGDPVMYAMAKSKVNSIFGMCVQKSIRVSDIEDFETGDYSKEKPQEGETRDAQYRRLYQKFCDSRSSFLAYQWGCWCTSIAMRQLFYLSLCIKKDPESRIKRWIYSDTDSIYSDSWDEKKVERFNKFCRDALKLNKYGAAYDKEGREYWLGTAVSHPTEDKYSEFVVVGPKRYCGRCIDDNKLHITVAGVPKKGAECLKDDINNFTKDFIFKGEETGKLTHFYNYVDDIFIDEYGNECGDSIDLAPCDYKLDDSGDAGKYLDQIMFSESELFELEVNSFEEEYKSLL